MVFLFYVTVLNSLEIACGQITRFGYAHTAHIQGNYLNTLHLFGVELGECTGWHTRYGYCNCHSYAHWIHLITIRPLEALDISFPRSPLLDNFIGNKMDQPVWYLRPVVLAFLIQWTVRSILTESIQYNIYLEAIRSILIESQSHQGYKVKIWRRKEKEGWPY